MVSVVRNGSEQTKDNPIPLSLNNDLEMELTGIGLHLTQVFTRTYLHSII